jgi:hypothetical protein
MTEDIKQAVALLPKLSISYDKNGLQELNEFPMLPHYRNILITALRALEPIAAETHVIVPREPIEKQIQYGNNEMSYVSASPSSIYRAMLRGFVGPFDEEQVASQEPKP